MEKNNLFNFKLIGNGSFGNVYSKGNIIYKEFEIIKYIENSNFFLIENNLREIIFYKIIKNKFISPPCNISFSQKISIKNNVSRIYLDNYGFTLNSLKLYKLKDIFKDNYMSIFKSIFNQLFTTINLFLENNISHGDLKPGNILINYKSISDYFKVTIVDYGSVCLWHKNYFKTSYQRCTIFYVSPEELLNNVYSKYNDIWSLGIILFEFITDKNFIKTLLELFNINRSTIKKFLKYSSFTNKKSKSFDPYFFLRNIYKHLTMYHISVLINTYITDHTQKCLVISLLTINPEQRYFNFKNLLNFFDVDEQFINLIKPDTYNNEKIIEIKNLPLNYKYFRENIIEIIFHISKIEQKFTEYIVGHSIMLLDSFFIKLNNFSLDKLHVEVIILLVLVFSSLILKAEFIKGKDILKLYKKYFSKNINSDKTILNDIHLYSYLFIGLLNFDLFYISPDMLFENLTIEIIHDCIKVYKSYLLTNESTYDIYLKILHQISPHVVH